MAFVGLAVVAYIFYYLLDVVEQQGASPFEFVNAVGLVVVVVGLIAAAVIFRRSSPP